MGIVRGLVGQENNSIGFSMEEIDAEVEALDVHDDEAVEAAVELPAEEIEADFDDAVEEIEEEAGDIEEAEEVVGDLEVAATAMEAFIERGAISQEEYNTIVGFASGSMARLGLESRSVALEGASTDAARIEQLRLAQEDLKETAAKIKEAIKEGAAKFKKLIGPMFEKFMALLGNRTMRAKVALRKLSKLGDAQRETIRIAPQVDRYINDENPIKTLDAVQTAANHVYKEFQADLRDWALHKTDAAPNVKQAVLDKVPFKPEVLFSGPRVKVNFDRVKGRARDAAIASKDDIKKILEASIKALDTVRIEWVRWHRWSTVLLAPTGPVGVVIMHFYSRGTNAVNAIQQLYHHFCNVIVGSIAYAERHIAGYAKA